MTFLPGTKKSFEKAPYPEDLPAAIGQDGLVFIGWGETEMTGLPVGSTLDEEKGIFYWSTGPGFFGPRPGCKFRSLMLPVGNIFHPP